jgi:hypothetical protein
MILSDRVIPTRLTPSYRSNCDHVDQKEICTLRFCKIILLCAAYGVMPAVAHAQWEVEVDPTAFALKGFSAHVGHPIFRGKAHIQLGAFGAETPEWIHGNSGFTENSRGATFKFDFFPKHPGRGVFIGADGNEAWVRYELESIREHTYRNLFGLGPRIGYRFNLGSHLYVSPWVAVDYQFNARDVVISGKTFHESPYSVFPAAHIGWSF